jgi:hypothetical protein
MKDWEVEKLHVSMNKGKCCEVRNSLGVGVKLQLQSTCRSSKSDDSGSACHGIASWTKVFRTLEY